MDNIRKVHITGPTSGNVCEVESNNALPVNIQDQHTEIIDLLLFVQEASFTLNAGMSIGDTSFTATAGHGITVGDHLHISESSRSSECVVINVVSNTITIDRPIDYAFTTSAVCGRGYTSLNVDGSVTPVEASIAPPTGVEWDIVRITLYIQDGTNMDDAKFGGLSALTNGIVLRCENVITNNIFNAKTNGDLALHMYDITYTSKAPSGSYGLRGRRTFGGQSKNGVTVRLNGNNGDSLKLIIQDDLTGLEEFNIVAQGHVVTN